MIIVKMNRLKKERKKAYDGLISLLLIETCIDGYMEESTDWVDVFELYLIGILQERELREAKTKAKCYDYTAPEEK